MDHSTFPDTSHKTLCASDPNASIHAYPVDTHTH